MLAPRSVLSVGAEFEATLELSELEIAVDGGVEAEALVGAVAEGTFVIAENGISLEYNVGAMAGAKFTAHASTSVSLSGRELASIEGKGGVTAGYVVGASGKFVMRGGKIALSLGLAAPAIVPVGATAEVSPSVNLNPVANAIAGGFSELAWEMSPSSGARKILTDPSKQKAALIKDLQKYSDKKIKNLATDPGTEHYVNLDTVQMYVKQNFPTNLLQGKGVDSAVCDQAIAEAIKATVKAKPDKPLEVTVVKGEVREIKNMAEIKNTARTKTKSRVQGKTSVEVGGEDG